MTRRVRALAAHELRVLWSDPASVVVLIALPLALSWFVKPAFAVILRTDGLPSANGSEQAVPGFGTMFSLFISVFVATSFMREHGWGTWNRLRAMAGSVSTIILGKTLPMIAIATVQMSLLFLSGYVLFHLRLDGRAWGLPAVVICSSVLVVALGMLIAAAVRNSQQLTVLGNLGTIVLAAVGGAVTPFSTLPWFVRKIGPASPCYWEMRGFRAAIDAGAPWSSVFSSCLVLLLFALAFTLLSARLFRAEDKKIAWG